MEPLAVVVQVQSVACQASNDGFGASEPYLWTVFFKIDGDTASVDDSLTLQGTATVVAPPVARGNLLETMRAGATVAVPAAAGTYHALLKPIPLTTPFLDQSAVVGGIGCVVALFEQDASNDQRVTSAYTMLRDSVQAALDTVIPTLNFSTREIKAATSEAVHKQLRAAVKRAVQDAQEHWTDNDSWRNDDDVIGIGVWYCAADELAATGAQGRSFTEHWDAAGTWTVIGRIALEGSPTGEMAKG